MTTWTDALRDGMVSGSIGSATSTLALAARGERENGTPFGTTNAISRWIWGDRAIWKDELSGRYTAVGYGIHHASSTLWAVVYEKWFGKAAEDGRVGTALAGGAAVAAMACFTDYRLTPYRLEPGFNQRLSNRSMAMVYGAFGLGLALRGLAVARAKKRMEY